MTDTPSESNGRIFISYRRQDSAYPAGWLYDRLVERFGPDQIFKDVDSIELGDDFVDTITNAVGSCDVVLALIGKKWASIKSGRERRLDDPNDFVRLEIEAALERNVLLIPILVDGALMPRADDLPPSVAPLVRRQALELSPNRFRSDTDTLLGVLDRTLADIEHGDDPVEVAAPVDIAPAEEPQAEEPPAEEPAAEEPATEEPAAEEPPAEPVDEQPTKPAAGSRRILLGVGAAVAIAAVATAAFLVMQPDDTKEQGGGFEDPAKPSAGETQQPQLGGSGAPTVLAHRGGEEEFAWQTLPAFKYAAGIGAQVETDVRWTKDGTAVLVHDPGTTPGMECEGGDLQVKDETWSLLRDTCRSPAAKSKDDKQYPIPTFDQAVSAVAKYPGTEMFAEVKVKQSARQVRQFVTILQSHNMTERAVVTSFFPEELAKIRAQAEEDGVENLRTMQFVSGERQPAAELAELEHWGVAVKYNIITKDYVKELNDAGLQVLIWIVNTPEQWQLADDVGADLVLTAKPKAYGAWAEVN